MSLRKMTESDLEQMLKWRNSPDVRNNMYNNHIISIEEHYAWFKKVSNDSSVQNLIYENEGEAIGVIAFSQIDSDNETASWAFYVGETEKRGVGIKMEKEALEYAFTQLNLNKLWCEVLSFNEKVIKFHQRFGFQIEGIFKSQFKREGELFDIYRLAIFKQDWLEKKK